MLFTRPEFTVNVKSIMRQWLQNGLVLQTRTRFKYVCANTWKMRWWTVFRGLCDKLSCFYKNLNRFVAEGDVHRGCSVCFFTTFKKISWKHFSSFFTLQLYVRSCFLIDLITITSVDTLVWQLNLCTCRNAISLVLTQLQLPVMSTAPICAPVSFSSPPLIHSHRQGALCPWLVVKPSFLQCFFF